MPRPSATSETDHTATLAKYAALYTEAHAVRGSSLGRDAWRRLRRNRVAMVSLVYLVLLFLLALFTPLLPLQSPRKQVTANIFSGPRFIPLFQQQEIFTETEPEKKPPAPGAIAKSSPDADENSNAEADVSADDETARRQTEMIRASFGELNRFDLALVKLRRRFFGEWCVTSICGTDNLGRDLLARLFWGARVSLLVGVVAALVSLVIGVSYGAISGYAGGRVDNLMMRALDVLYSIPFIFIVILMVTFMSEPATKERLASIGIDRLAAFYLIVGAIYWLTMARVVRGQIVSLKNEQFVEAARTIGASRARIIFLHLVPNLLSVIIVYLTLTIPSVMLFEAFLSFLGLGVEAPDVSWGVLANEGIAVITPVRIFWWLVVFPGLALGLTLFALNFLGDGLRDALDPRLKHRT